MARNYMMRSEKRESTLQTHRTSAKKQPPKRRRKGAGFLYSFCMYFLLLFFWPFGLLMLWRKKVRWNAGMKLLVSIVTLAALVLIYGFALTVDTGNEAYTEIQDNVNSALDVSADWLIQAGKTAGEKSGVVFDGAKNLTGALLEKGRETLPDVLDKGVEIADMTKKTFVGLADKVGLKPESPEEAVIEETVLEEEAEAAALSEATHAPVGKTSAQKRIEVSVSKTDSRLPIYIPEQTPDAEGKPLVSGKLKRGLSTPTPTPRPTPVSTPVPSAEPEADADAAEEPVSEN